MKTIATDHITKAVIAGCIKGKELDFAKKGIPDGGAVTGEMIVRIPFQLTKGHATEIRPTASILSQAVLAKALIYSGVTADAFKAALLKAATEALNAEHTVAQELKDEDKRITEELAQLQQDVIAKLPKIPRSGSVSIKVMTQSGAPVIEMFRLDEPEEVEVAA